MGTNYISLSTEGSDGQLQTKHRFGDSVLFMNASLTNFAWKPTS